MSSSMLFAFVCLFDFLAIVNLTMIIKALYICLKELIHWMLYDFNNKNRKSLTCIIFWYITNLFENVNFLKANFVVHIKFNNLKNKLINTSTYHKHGHVGAEKKRR